MTARIRTPQRSGTRLAAAAGLAVALLAGCGDSPDRLMQKAGAAREARDLEASERHLKAALRKRPDSVDARLMLAAVHASRHDAPSAAKEWQRALELGARPEQALPGLVAALVTAGDASGALAAAQGARIEAIAPRAALAYWSGRAHEALGRRPEAERLWQTTLQIDPQHVPARVALLRLQAERGDAQGTGAALDAILARQPSQPDAWMLKADLALARGDAPGARQALARAVDGDVEAPLPRTRLVSLLIDLGAYGEAGDQLTVLERLAPGLPATRHLRALIDLNEGRLVAARDGAQRILSTNPDFLPAVALAATVSLREGALEQAERYALQLLDAAPGSVQGARLLASAQLRRDEPSRARATADAAYARGLRDAPLLGIAGEAALRTGDLAAATGYFEKASRIDPDDPSRLTGLGLARLSAGQQAAGFEALEQAAERDLRSTRADLALVTARMRAGQFDRALVAVERMIRKDPRAPLAHNLHGTVLLGRGDVGGARAAFDQALAIDPAFFAAAANLAQLDLRAGQPDQARGRFEAVLAKDPRNVAALGALARLATQAGRHDEASGLLRRAHDADPTALEPALALATDRLRADRPAQALVPLQAAATRHGAEPRLLELLSDALLRTDQAQQALDVLERRVRLDPRSAALQVQLGAVRAVAGDVEGAIAALRIAGELDADAATRLTGRVVTTLGTTRRAEVVRMAQMLRKQAPANPVGPALEADLAAAERRWPDAAAAWRDAVSLRRTAWLTARLHGALRDAGRSDEAAAVLREGLQAMPRDTELATYAASAATTAR
ncbi:MAG: PEP-CTERM system TPR-repeat protein PrsT [Burkholderiales bacterium]|nr:MAG: PEP-CTERM system TPR-repeat protein PrsT [Burkholderiales bacterium]